VYQSIKLSINQSINQSINHTNIAICLLSSPHWEAFSSLSLSLSLPSFLFSCV